MKLKFFCFIRHACTNPGLSTGYGRLGIKIVCSIAAQLGFGDGLSKSPSDIVHYHFL